MASDESRAAAAYGLSAAAGVGGSRLLKGVQAVGMKGVRSAQENKILPQVKDNMVRRRSGAENMKGKVPMRKGIRHRRLSNARLNTKLGKVGKATRVGAALAMGGLAYNSIRARQARRAAEVSTAQSNYGNYN